MATKKSDLVIRVLNNEKAESGGGRDRREVTYSSD